MKFKWMYCGLGAVTTVFGLAVIAVQIGRQDRGTTNPQRLADRSVGAAERPRFESTGHDRAEFRAASVQAPRYEQAMRELAEAEATGRLPEPPPADAPPAELRAFGSQWQREWGPNFDVKIQDAGPLLSPGQAAPEWKLNGLDGVPVVLEQFLGKCVLMQFGSLSCPTTCLHVPEFDSLAAKYESAGVIPIFVYGREAHPGDQFGFGVIPQAFSLEERARNARRLAAMFGLNRCMVIDDMSNSTKRAYGAQDNSAYLIDREGRVILTQVFFDSTAMDRELAKAVEFPGTKIN